MSIIQGTGGGLGGAGAPGGALAGGAVYSYELNQSLRFDHASSTVLHRTPSSSSNRSTWSFSCWLKRGKLTATSTNHSIFSAGTNVFNRRISLDLNVNNTLNLFMDGRADGASYYNFITDRVFRDPSAWYHILAVLDTTDSAADDRIKLYVNGERQSGAYQYGHGAPPLNSEWSINHTYEHDIGDGHHNSVVQFFDGYIAEVNHIDGTALDPTSFGETVDGVWVPKAYSGSYGTNGFYLSFADSAAIGDDLSGNTNDFTATNLAAHDVVPDSPTNNFATWNSVHRVKSGSNAATYTEGSLKAASGGNSTHVFGSFGINPTDTQGYYWEIKAISIDTARSYIGIVAPEGGDGGNASYQFAKKFVLNRNDDLYGNDGSGGSVVSYTSWTTNDILMVAYKNGKIWIGKNGTWMNSGNPAAGTGDIVAQDGGRPSDRGDVTWFPYAGYNSTYTANFGQEGTFAGTETAGGNSDENGYGDFKYSVPSGFLAMCSANLPDITIGPGQDTQADDHFETMLYTGNGSGQSIGSGGAQHPQDTITIANSLKFNHADSSFLSYQPGANGATKIMTYSGWIKLADTSKYHILLQAVSGSYDALWIEPTNDKLQVVLGSTSTAVVSSTRAFKNVSKWYHICVNVDTTQATASDRIKIWIDGVQETLTGTQPAQDATFSAWFKSGITHRINFEGGSTYGNGYIAEVHVAEGIAYDYTYFGQVGTNGYWIPKTVSGITYGDEGFYLDFADSAYIGDDESGNTNDFTATNIAATDVTIDSPTQNFATLDPNTTGMTGTLSEGNLKVVTQSTGSDPNTQATFGVSSGKWYWEAHLNDTSVHYQIGITRYQMPGYADISSGSEHQVIARAGAGATRVDTSDVETGITAAVAGDIIGFALDMDNKTIQFYNNGSVFGNAVDFSYLDNFETVTPWIVDTASSITVTAVYNFGADDSFAGNKTASSGAQAADGNGYGSFYYTPPTDYLALVDDNIPQGGINSPDWLWIKERSSTSGHFFFDTVRGVHKYVQAQSTNTEVTDTTQVQSFDNQGFTIGSSTGINQSTVTNVAWTWKAGGPSPTQTYTVKVVSDSGNKYRFDDFGTSAITLSLQEGGTYTFDQSDSSNSGHPLRFSTTSDGTHGGGSEYTVGVTTSGTPGSSGAKTVITVAHGAPTLYYYCNVHSGMGGQANTTETHGSTNVKGSTQAVVTANQDAGLSVVSYTGTGANATIGHGLTTAPESIIIKGRTRNENWLWYHKFDGGTDGRSFLNLNTTGGKFDNGPGSYFQDTPPTASVFYQNNSSYNTSTDTYIAYCFHSVEGYSKIGSFVGYSNSDGTFVYLGFRPAWVLIKSTSSATNSCIFDSKRLGFNVDNNLLRIDSATEQTDDDVDFLSNGLKFRRSSTNFNNSSHTYVYIAFAEAPFKFVNAR